MKQNRIKPNKMAASLEWFCLEQCREVICECKGLESKRNYYWAKSETGKHIICK